MLNNLKTPEGPIRFELQPQIRKIYFSNLRGHSINPITSISDKIKPFSEYSTLELQSRDNGYWYWNVWVHNEDDLLDALTIHPSFTNLIPAHSYAISLRTKHFVRSSTMSTPCSKHRQRTCKDHFVKKAIANQYGCQVCIKF